MIFFIVIVIPNFYFAISRRKKVSKNIKGLTMTGKRGGFEGLKKPLTLPISGVREVGPPTSGVTQPPPVNLHPCEYTLATSGRETLEGFR